MWNRLKISEVFFEEYGLPMLEKDFPEYKDQIAAGLVGQTSECFGYDDYIACEGSTAYRNVIFSIVISVCYDTVL